jgi:hypothetical protein
MGHHDVVDIIVRALDPVVQGFKAALGLFIGDGGDPGHGTSKRETRIHHGNDHRGTRSTVIVSGMSSRYHRNPDRGADRKTGLPIVVDDVKLVVTVIPRSG